MTAPRQTASYLMKRFSEVGIRPQSQHGQNFLVDLNLIDIVIDAADLGPQDVVLEIGTGTGSLTALLAERAGQVITVELDPALHQLASDTLVDFDNVVMLQQDALKNKNHFHPRVLEQLQQALAAAPGRQLKLVANLPYNIATPVLSNLLYFEPLPVSMTATIQKEVAERILAQPRTKDYSALSVWMQSQCDVELLRTLPPTVFWPRPKVDSAIIQVRPNREKRARIKDLKSFHQFVRGMFFHRRKFLRAELVSFLKDRAGKSEVDVILAEMQFPAQTRAEELDVDMLLSLYDCVSRHVSLTAE
ncbi:MAG: 16S rRNA (adenine(1518)-N(6)/adenine(1519)-N(6))-dimethyltransferase RsmA [Planctomycetota bacterium]